MLRQSRSMSQMSGSISLAACLTSVLLIQHYPARRKCGACLTTTESGMSCPKQASHAFRQTTIIILPVHAQLPTCIATVDRRDTACACPATHMLSTHACMLTFACTLGRCDQCQVWVLCIPCKCTQPESLCRTFGCTLPLLW